MRPSLARPAGPSPPAMGVGDGDRVCGGGRRGGMPYRGGRAWPCPSDPASDLANGVMGVYRKKTLVPRQGTPRERRQVKGKRPTGRASRRKPVEGRVPPETAESSVGGKSKSLPDTRRCRARGIAEAERAPRVSERYTAGWSRAYPNLHLHMSCLRYGSDRAASRRAPARRGGTVRSRPAPRANERCGRGWRSTNAERCLRRRGGQPLRAGVVPHPATDLLGDRHGVPRTGARSEPVASRRLRRHRNVVDAGRAW